MSGTTRVPVSIPAPSYIKDHRFQGHAVLPAVEALELLAGTVAEHRDIAAKRIVGAEFTRFLPIPDDADAVDAVVELEPVSGGNVAARLVTEVRSEKLGTTRTKEHVRATFGGPVTFASFPLLDLVALPGPVKTISVESLYAEMVPFGPAFHNVCGDLFLNESGALCRVRAPETGSSKRLLGSPFPVDAAFHAACAWGQRHAGIVGFPVGFAERSIVEATRPGETLFARIVPTGDSENDLLFDLCLFDDAGGLRETVTGLRMRDVSRGKMKPPEGIIADGTSGPLSAIRSVCRATCVIELATLAPFAHLTFSDRELTRHEKHKGRRVPSYSAARVALKRLALALWPGSNVSPDAIETVDDDLTRPCLRLPDGRETPVSVSHDKRFAIAAAGERRIGVDVEAKSEKMLRGLSHYMDEAERMLATESDNLLDAAARIWTIKESAAKALDVPLPTAWSHASVTRIGADESVVDVGGVSVIARHAEIDDHVFTVLQLPKGMPRPSRPAFSD